MDNQPAPNIPTPPVHSSITSKMSQKQKILLMSLAIVLVLTSFGVYYFFFQPETSINQTQLSGDRFYKVDDRIAKVGEEILYGSDFNYMFDNYTTYIYRPADKGVVSKENPEDVKNVLDYLTHQSMVLQVARTQKLIELNDKIYNNPNKDWSLRVQTYANAIRLLESKEEKVTISMISAWYYNTKPPKGDVEAARLLAKSKIEKVHADIKSGKITFEQGGKLLASDVVFADLDFNYKRNNYVIIRNRPVSSVFTFEPMNEVMRKLNPGQVSEIIEINAKELDPKAQLDERFFAFMKLNSAENKGLGTYDSLMNQARKDLKTEVYIKV